MYGPPEKGGICNPTQAGVSVLIGNSGIKEAINSSRSWQIGRVVITLKFASREMFNSLTCGTLCPVNLVETIAGQLIVLSE